MNRGRPKKISVRKNQVNVRLSDDDYSKLEYLSFRTGKPKSDLLRDGLDILYKFERNKN